LIILSIASSKAAFETGVESSSLPAIAVDAVGLAARRGRGDVEIGTAEERPRLIPEMLGLI